MRRHLPLVGFTVLGATLALGACGGGGSSDASSSKPDRATSTQSTARATETSASGSATVPCVSSGATLTGTRPLGATGVETDYTTNEGYQAVLSACTSSMRAAGWTVQGGGGGGWGGNGGGGLGATKGAATVQVNAGSNAGQTYVNVCSWPGAQSNDGCGDQDNDGNNDDNQDQQNQNQNQNQQDQDQQQNG
jgi:hypothetical protein